MWCYANLIRGYRVTVISRIPIDKSTIIYGSDDAVCFLSLVFIISIIIRKF